MTPRPGSMAAWKRRALANAYSQDDEHAPRSTDKRWKGKARDTADYPEGNGGTDGIVLPLDVVGGGIFDVAYTLPIKVGSDSKTFSVQVDTGSSDLWLASSSCSSSSCNQAGGKLYNPEGATETGKQFSIPYLQGSASGPIVWDTVDVGGYVVDTQALSAANDVQNEPLSPQFTGILGLALPLNSIISQAIPPVTGNAPDGASWASNLFSITPFSSAPPTRFLSLALARPGSDRVPSVLGIGKHPSTLVKEEDVEKVQYSTLVSESSGAFFWKTGVRDISVYVDGERRSVDIGMSNTGAPFPNAVLDSGVPLILTTRAVANAIYGAIGIGPGSDGQYYVPCTTPLNITITLDNRSELPIHPLDLTGEPPQDNRAVNCIGLIQAEDRLMFSSSGIGDMILGVPFLRNTYTVMGYSTPDSDGVFPANNNTESIKPRLGLLGLTDPTVALDEFHTVRVLNQPLPSSGGSSSSTSSGNSTSTDKKGLSVGIIVLISLLAFFALCFALFFLRFFLLRRRLRKVPLADDKNAYHLAQRDNGLPSEDELRRMRYDEYVRKERALSLSMGGGALGTGVTLVEPAFEKVGEFGTITMKDGVRDGGDDPWDPKTALDREGDDTLVVQGRGGKESTSPESSPETFHRRTLTELEGHKRQLSITVPLLPNDDIVPHQHQDQDDMGEFVVRTSMAGVGTANRTRGPLMGTMRDSISTGGSISFPPGVVFDSPSAAVGREHSPSPNGHDRFSVRDGLEGTPTNADVDRNSLGHRGT